MAARSGNLPVAQLLVSRGADLNAQNLDNLTPLVVAAKEGKKDSFHQPAVQVWHRIMQDQKVSKFNKNSQTSVLHLRTDLTMGLSLVGTGSSHVGQAICTACRPQFAPAFY